MTQEERLDNLIADLIREKAEYQTIHQPDSAAEKRQLLRALMNVRPPLPVSNEFLKVQDEYLQEEIRCRGTTSLADLTPVQPGLYLWQGDITTLAVDAIVNAANSRMLGCFVPCHGCIDNAIHSAAGIQLRNECARLMEEQGHDEPTGKAKITLGYNLPAKHVIHTVGPIVGVKVTKQQEEELKSCYLNCLRTAEKNHLDSIAFCCISTGEFHFPNKLAAQIAVETVDKYLSGSGMKRVIFNVFKDEDLHIYQKLFR